MENFELVVEKKWRNSRIRSIF